MRVGRRVENRLTVRALIWEAGARSRKSVIPAFLLLRTYVSPLTGLEISMHTDPGRRFAAVAASLCPGLICDGPSGLF